MGSQSFGKGSVQTVAKIDETQGIKLTIVQYMTLKEKDSGNWDQARC